MSQAVHEFETEFLKVPAGHVSTQDDPDKKEPAGQDWQFEASGPEQDAHDG
jgi:hypothetical protein